MKYSVAGSKVKEEIVVSGPDEIADSYEFELRTKGLLPQAIEGGGVSFLESSGKQAFVIRNGTSWDSNKFGNRAPVRIELSSDKNSIVVIPDRTWLHDSTRVFPVTIDPTIELGHDWWTDYASNDAYTASFMPDDTFNSVDQLSGNGAEYINKAGKPNSNEEYTTLMKIRTSELNNLHVLDSRLVLFSFDEENGTSPLCLYPTPMTGTARPLPITRGQTITEIVMM